MEVSLWSTRHTEVKSLQMRPQSYRWYSSSCTGMDRYHLIPWWHQDSAKNPPSQRSEIVTFDPTIPHEFNFQIIEFNPTLEALWQSQTPKPCHIHLQFQGQDLQQIAPVTTLQHGLGWEENGLQNVQERLIHFGLSLAKNSLEHRNYHWKLWFLTNGCLIWQTHH